MTLPPEQKVADSNSAGRTKRINRLADTDETLAPSNPNQNVPAAVSAAYARKIEAFQKKSQRTPTIPAYADPEVAAKLKGAAVSIKLTKGMFALVDIEDEPLVRRYSWQAKLDECGNWYAYRSFRLGGKKRQESMHRYIMGAQPGQRVDHINGQTTDNRRRENLRFCTNTQNVRNAGVYGRKSTSKYKGVYFNKENRRFRAQIMCSKIKINLGNFDCEEDAARAYDEAARKLFGTFARTNFPAKCAAAS